jgi:hypothetical protein
MSLLGGLFGRNKPTAPDPAAIYADLRSQALAWTAQQAGMADSGDIVYAVLLDMGFGSGTTATIVAVGEGTASMYTSTGGGVIGAGEHPSVAAASKALVAEAERSRSLLSRDWQDGPLSDGQVRLIALTPSGPLGVSGSADAWIADGSPMQPVFGAANDLIYQIRTASDG